jgi:hypothetical protein
VDAIDRIGDGLWHERVGRLLASGISELITDSTRAVRMLTNADPEIRDDLPNEYGIPSLNPDGTGDVDNHQILTGTGMNGRLYNQDASGTGMILFPAALPPAAPTTSGLPKRPRAGIGPAPSAAGCPRVGHSWPRDISGINWISVWNEGGCAPGGVLENVGTGGPDGTARIGSAGGYGGWYCFAILP